MQLLKLRRLLEFAQKAIYNFNRRQKLIQELQQLDLWFLQNMDKIRDTAYQLEFYRHSLKEYIKTLTDEEIKNKGGGIISIIETIKNNNPFCIKHYTSIQLYLQESPNNIDPNEARKILEEYIDACLSPIIHSLVQIPIEFKKYKK